MRFGWARHVERIRERKRTYGILVGKPEGRTPTQLGRPGTDGRIILRKILEKWDVGTWIQ